MISRIPGRLHLCRDKIFSVVLYLRSKLLSLKSLPSLKVMSGTLNSMRGTMFRSKRLSTTTCLSIFILSLIFALSLLKFSSRTIYALLYNIQEATFETSLESFPKGHVYPNLHRQALSHQAFHASAFKLELALLSLRWPGCNRTAVIVGVEFGGEMRHFADNGFRVIGFEPNPRFALRMREYMAQNASWDATLYEKAVGAEPGQITVAYQGEKQVQAPVVRLDDYINETVAVLSVDIQGAENAVIKGAMRLQNSSISMIWFEAYACNERVADILKLLDEQYVMFDFVPWGLMLGQPGGERLTARGNYVFDPNRPSTFDDYMKWFCGIKEQNYRYIQTDIIAVRRSIIPFVIHDLNRIGEKFCNLESERCVLRKIVF